MNIGPLEPADSDRGEAVFLKILFSSLNAQNIPYAVMRNYEQLPNDLKGSDLDILFDPFSKQRVMNVVTDSISRADGAVIGCAETVGFSKIVAFGVCANSISEWWGVRLDLSFGLYYSGCSNLLAGHVLRERVGVVNEISVLSPDLAALLGVMKEILHNSTIPSRYLGEARSGIHRNWLQLCSDINPVGRAASCSIHKLCMGEHSEVELSAACKKLRKEVYLTSFRRSPLKFVFSRMKFELSKLQRYLKPPGLMLAMLGTDGAGKSTIISAVTPILENATHGDITVRHLRPTLLPPLARLKGGGGVSVGAVTDPQGSEPSGQIASIFRLLYLALDYILGYWFLVRPKIAKSPTVYLFDRYAYDMAIDPKRFRISLPGWLLQMVIRLLPQPDIIVCLTGDPALIVKRKMELPLYEVARQVRCLEELAKSNPCAFVVSTDVDVSETRDGVLIALLQYCSSNRV